MQAARLLCQSTPSFCPWRRWSHLQRVGSSPLKLSMTISSFPPSQPHDHSYFSTRGLPSRTASTRAPSTEYEVPRRVVTPYSVPQFLRRTRRVPDGSYTSVPVPRLARSTQEIERELKWVANNKPSLPTIREILTVLIKHRQQRPKAAYYEALILGNCDPEHGSVANVEALLEEMKDEDIMIGTSIHRAVFKFLTVFPNRNLRERNLEDMNRQWMVQAGIETKHDMVASLIRDDELELARLQLDSMQKDGFAIERWVHVLLIHALCDRKDFEAILRLVYELFEEKKDLPRATWLWLLQQSVDHNDFHLIEWIWQHHVEPMYIRPDTSICVSALKIFAQHNKVKLAESAHGVLEALDPDVAKDYSGLLEEAYMRSGIKRDPTLHKRPNIFSIFGSLPADQNAFYDAKLALEKRRRQKLTNPRRLWKSSEHKARIKSLERRAKLKRRSR